MSRKLTRPEVRKVTCQAKTYFSKHGLTILKIVYESSIDEEHIKGNDSRKHICDTIFKNKKFLLKFYEEFCSLYESCHKGVYVIRLANLNLQWIKHVAKFLTVDTQEYIGLQKYSYVDFMDYIT